MIPWPVVVKEHLTEAIACRMAALKFGRSGSGHELLQVPKRDALDLPDTFDQCFEIL